MTINDSRYGLCDYLKCLKDAQDIWTSSADAGKKQRALHKLNKVYKSEPYAVKKAAMGESSGLAGGYIIPPQFSWELLNTISEESWLIKRCRLIEMTTPNMLLPTVNVEAVGGAGTYLGPASPGSSLFGGMTFSWKGFENTATFPETEPLYRQLQLNTWDLVGSLLLSNQQIDDMAEASAASSWAPTGSSQRGTDTIPPGREARSIGRDTVTSGNTAEDWLREMIAEAVIWQLEQTFLLGGLGTPNQMPAAIFNTSTNPALITTTRAGSGHIAAADIALLMSNLMPYNFQRCIFACHPTVLADLIKLSTYFLNEGGEIAPEEGSQLGTLMGRPLFITDKLPILGTLGDLVCFDPYFYAVGWRQDVLIDVSSHVAFNTNQSWIRVWWRGDGRPILQKKIPRPDGQTVGSTPTAYYSPFVAVAT